MNCYLCHSSLKIRYRKYSPFFKKDFNIYECPSCGLWQIKPVPAESELNLLYEENYFHQRTDRGYDFYESEKVKKSIENTFQKNLTDLNFFSWEKELLKENVSPNSLDIGCAAGYFVSYLKNRNWNSMGIDVSKAMINVAQKNSLHVINGDFLETPFQEKSFDLITMWATIEHLPDPLKFLEKISFLLKPKGKFILSTCNTGIFARIRKENWRFLNVPEHIFYFNKNNLNLAGKKYNLNLNKAFSYGSGFTARQNASAFYRITKKIFDSVARYFLTGDMIVIEYIRD